MAPKRGLGFKLASYVAVAAIVTSGAIGMGRVNSERAELSNFMLQAGQSIANTTAAGAASLIAGYDYGNLELLVDNVARQTNVVHITLRNASGRIVAQVDKSTHTEHRRIQAPILFEGKTIGEATVELSTADEAAAIRALYLRILFEQLIFAAILGSVLYFIASRGIVSPIRRLTETMEAAMARGEPYSTEPLPVESQDEVGRLMAVFNTLSKTLTGYHEQLQRKVQAADQALKDKNIELMARTEELEHTLALLGTMATTDWLTKLPNRRQFDETFERLAHQSQRFGEPLTLVLFDIDHFKQINDNHGHAAGDEVLSRIGSMVQDSVRKADLPARLGGDEFAVILYHTDETQAEVFVKQLVEQIKAHAVSHNGAAIMVTVSAGLAEFGGENDSPQALYFAADRALYAAKRKGRDCHVRYSMLSKEKEPS